MAPSKDELLMRALEKEFEQGTLTLASMMPDTKCISTGVPSVDWILNGGIPCGRLTELFGTEAGGKTSFAMVLMGTVQRRGGRVVYLDVEHTMDKPYAQKLGVDISRMLVAQPSSAEDGFKLLSRIVDKDTPGGLTSEDLLVVDSLDALIPAVLAEASADSSVPMALQARIVGGAIRKTNVQIALKDGSGCPVVFINQLRDVPGVVYGDKERTPGGRALKFYAGLRLEVSRGPALSEDRQRTGHQVHIKAVKCRHAIPYQRITLELAYGEGFNLIESLAESAIWSGVVQHVSKSRRYELEDGSVAFTSREEYLTYLSVQENYDRLYSLVLAKASVRAMTARQAVPSIEGLEFVDVTPEDPPDNVEVSP